MSSKSIEIESLKTTIETLTRTVRSQASTIISQRTTLETEYRRRNDEAARKSKRERLEALGNGLVSIKHPRAATTITKDGPHTANVTVKIPLEGEELQAFEKAFDRPRDAYGAALHDGVWPIDHVERISFNMV